MLGHERILKTFQKVEIVQTTCIVGREGNSSAEIKMDLPARIFFFKQSPSVFSQRKVIVLEVQIIKIMHVRPMESSYSHVQRRLGGLKFPFPPDREAEKRKPPARTTAKQRSCRHTQKSCSVKIQEGLL